MCFIFTEKVGTLFSSNSKVYETVLRRPYLRLFTLSPKITPHSLPLIQNYFAERRLKWGRGDLNPGSPAPQAGILDQARLRPHSTGHRPFLNGNIIKTLIKLKASGLSESTLEHVSYRLSVLDRNCSLDDPVEVSNFIANMKVANSYKNTFVKSYNYYVVLNGLSWNKPTYKYERKIPRIPTSEAINKMISRASRKYATIFKILMETGVMPFELSQVTERDIDLEKGVINVQGFKGHTSRSFKLKSDTVAMLKQYLQTYTCDKPFPNSLWIGKMWRKFRNSLSEKLKDPSLRTIRLYDLRHYYGTMTYHKTKDILYVKQQMGHKKLETTLLYTQLVDFENDEYTSAVAKTIEEARKLIESGFDYVTELDGVKLFKKRK